LGPGFDALGMALTLYVDVGVVRGVIPTGAHSADQYHPATIAFRHFGGIGDLWVRSGIPMGRGLGFSGAVRVGGAMLGALQSDPQALSSRDARHEVFQVTAKMEGHGDNVAASLMGGIVATNGTHAANISNACELEVVVWIPSFSTSTSESRTKLPDSVALVDAAFNVGHTALLIAALNSGDIGALAASTVDRLHEEVRFRSAQPSSLARLGALEAGAVSAWLSGSGPTVAAFCVKGTGASIAARLPAGGTAKVLDIDDVGVRATPQ